MGIFALDYILLKSPRLRYLILRTPSVSTCSRYWLDRPLTGLKWYSKMRTMYQDAIQDAQSGVLTKCIGVALLSEIGEEPHFDAHQCPRNVPTDFRWWLQNLQALAAVEKSIRHLRVRGHSIRELEIPTNIKGVLLSGAYTNSHLGNSKNIFHVASRLPQLKQLDIHAFPPSWGSGNDHLHDPGNIDIWQLEGSDGVQCQRDDTYHNGLLLYRDTLVRLDLQTAGLASSLTAAQGPQGQALRCLPSMSKLEHLTIELGMLFFPVLPGYGAMLGQRLPRHLKTLALIERWHPYLTCKEAPCQNDCVPTSNLYAFSLLQAMADWSLDCQDHQPNLTAVVLIHNAAWKPLSMSMNPVWNFVLGVGQVLLKVRDELLDAGGKNVAVLPMCEGRRQGLLDIECPGTFLSHLRIGLCVGPEITWSDIAECFNEKEVDFCMVAMERGKYYKSIPLH